MKTVENRQFDEERALYNSDGICVKNCRFDGPADGESALKESKNIEVYDSYFNLRYPFWHDDNLLIQNSIMTENCRAALWYTKNAEIKNSQLHGIKALRECSTIKISDCDIISKEFGWSVSNIAMKNTTAESEYFMMRSDHITFNNVKMVGKYSFQYISDSEFNNCEFDTKDAFWHAQNVIVRNCVVKGEYLAWYCDNVTFDHCTIIGTQPLCYCRNLKLIDCQMIDTDLAFERSEVEATVTTPVISIKNPYKGTIKVPEVHEIIMDDVNAKGQIIVG